MKPMLHKKFVFSLILIFSTITSASANEDWWFDVEVLLFKRNLQASLAENFDDAAIQSKWAYQRDLISLPTFFQAHSAYDVWRTLPSCTDNLVQLEPYQSPLTPQVIEQDNNELAQLIEVLSDENNNAIDFVALNEDIKRFESLSIGRSEQESSNEYMLSPLPYYIVNDISFLCANPLELSISEFPRNLHAQHEYVIGTEALLAQNYQRMRDYVAKVAQQPDITTLLHTSWRQRVEFGEDQADFFALFAGTKLILPDESRRSEQEITEEQYEDDKDLITVLSNIQADINANKEISWNTDAVGSENAAQTNTNTLDKVFEIEGRLKVYLDYVNRIPYLHIDADLTHYRFDIETDGSPYIKAFPFKQRRRIISKQIHYFDHPAFGMIIRLERYEPPTPEELASLKQTLND